MSDELIERLRAEADCGEGRRVKLLDEAADALAASIKRVKALEERDERVREAMFVLSDRLRHSGALNNDNIHGAYEAVVAALSDQPNDKKQYLILFKYKSIRI